MTATRPAKPIHLSGAKPGDVVLHLGRRLGVIARWTTDGCSVLFDGDKRLALTALPFDTDSVIVPDRLFASGVCTVEPGVKS